MADQNTEVDEIIAEFTRTHEKTAQAARRLADRMMRRGPKRRRTTPRADPDLVGRWAAANALADDSRQRADAARGHTERDGTDAVAADVDDAASVAEMRVAQAQAWDDRVRDVGLDPEEAQAAVARADMLGPIGDGPVSAGASDSVSAEASDQAASAIDDYIQEAALQEIAVSRPGPTVPELADTAGVLRPDPIPVQATARVGSDVEITGITRDRGNDVELRVVDLDA